jgi:methionyl-tRNA formyltransferase
MNTAGLFLMGKKGLRTLEATLCIIGAQNISYLVVERDANTRDDTFEMISALGKSAGLNVLRRSSFCPERYTPPSLTISAGWRWMLDLPGTLVVLHDSLLPRYRGFAPLVNMLKNGEKEIGVTAFLSTDEYDKGPVIAQERRLIQYPIRIDDAINIVSEAYFALTSKLLIDFANNAVKVPSPQDEDAATYSLWLDDDDYWIDWNDSAEEIARFVDAVSFPYKGARTRLNGLPVVVNRAQVMDDRKVEQRTKHTGKVIFRIEGRPVVLCGSGLLRLDELLDLKTNAPIADLPFRSRFTSKLGPLDNS